MTNLILDNNKLPSIDLTNCRNLKMLSARDNFLLAEMNQLPSTLDVLGVDLDSILKYDFKHLDNLKKLFIFSDHETDRSALLNLGDDVEFCFEKVGDEESEPPSNPLFDNCDELNSEEMDDLEWQQ